MSLQTYRIKIRPDGLLKYLNDSLKIHIFYAYIVQIFSCEYMYIYIIFYIYIVYLCVKQGLTEQRAAILRKLT